MFFVETRNKRNPVILKAFQKARLTFVGAMLMT